jgi:hypothetical protein
MTNEIRQMIRLATGGALIGGGIGGTLFSLIGTLLVGLQPVVMLACGMYAGAVYGGIVGTVIGAREPRLESEPVAGAVARRTPGLALAVARPRYD